MPSLREPLAKFLVALFALLLAAPFAWAGAITLVVHVSVDGLGSSAVEDPASKGLASFDRLRTEGVSTLNARTDVNYTGTLPNHVSQLTGRGVDGVDGHNWTYNTDPPWPAGCSTGCVETLEDNKGTYVAGVFDVVHGAGGRTGAYVSKEKLSLFEASWGDQIDVFEYESDTPTLVSLLVADLTDPWVDPFAYVFLHLVDPDTAGHASGWGSAAYQDAVERVDGELGDLFDAIEATPALRDHTAIILTADHGGRLGNHGDPTALENYTIPFFVWGPGVAPGADLYGLNPATRLDPETGRPLYSDPMQPARNGDAANLALDLLGLGPVPGSTINARQDLKVSASVPEPGVTTLLGVGGALLVWLERRRLRGRGHHTESPHRRP